jgi:hypothetical protein
MFQFDTKLITLQLLPLKMDVYCLTIQQKDIREKNSRVQRTKFYESHSYFGDTLGPIVEK